MNSSPSSRTPAAAGAVDRAWLERAVELGRRGWGQVHPNPMVGCVLVRPGGGEGGEGELLGEGWHRAWGGPHAEVEALAAARQGGHDPRGATAYVSLEPCNHQGKTPPCTLALRTAGVARVVYGAADPGVHSGEGGAALAAQGIEVVGPVFDGPRARRENPAFFHAFGPEAWRPWVLLKLAVSADGHIAARPGERTPISGPEAGEEVQRLRAGVDAIVVGGRTAAVDDPLLTVRGPVTPRVPPRRVILDAAGQVGPGARVFHEGEGEVLHLVGEEGEGGSQGREGSGRSREESGRGREESDRGREGVGEGREGEPSPAPLVPVRREVLPLASPGKDDLPRFDLTEVMTRLRALGVSALLCEGGGHLASALLAEGLVDRLVLVSSPRRLGGEGVPAFPGAVADPTGPGAPWVSEDGWTPVAPPRSLGQDLWQMWDREER